MWVVRQLEHVLRDLVPLVERGKVTKLLNAPEDVDRLGNLAEDIRNAMMDYQVRPQSTHSAPPNVFARHRHNKIHMPFSMVYTTSQTLVTAPGTGKGV